MADMVEVVSPSGSPSGNENSLGSTCQKATNRATSSSSDSSILTSTGSSGSPRRNPTDLQDSVIGVFENAQLMTQKEPKPSEGST